MLAASFFRKGAARGAHPLTRLALPCLNEQTSRLNSRSLSVPPSSSGEVPVLDLAASDDVIVPKVAAACSEWGFFQVVNHGVEHALCRRFRQQMVSLFDMPR